MFRNLIDTSDAVYDLLNSGEWIEFGSNSDSWIKFDQKNFKFFGYPQKTNLNKYEILLNATDGYKTVYDSFYFTITN